MIEERKPFRVTIRPGVEHYPAYFDHSAQQGIVDTIRAIVAAAPLYRPVMPRTGKPMRVLMTNCGTLGWLTDRDRGYRYQPTHPETGTPWPPMPALFLALWNEVAGDAALPEAGLINFYDHDAKMGMHQDRDEATFDAPVVSVSLGDDARFRIGGTSRGGPTQSVRLQSGDVLVFGGEARLAYHGIDRVYPGTSALLAKGGRLNVTLRRVTPP